jgi:hypothetical protein
VEGRARILGLRVGRGGDRQPSGAGPSGLRRLRCSASGAPDRPSGWVGGRVSAVGLFGVVGDGHDHGHCPVPPTFGSSVRLEAGFAASLGRAFLDRN